MTKFFFLSRMNGANQPLLNAALIFQLQTFFNVVQIFILFNFFSFHNFSVKIEFEHITRKAAFLLCRMVNGKLN